MLRVDLATPLYPVDPAIPLGAFERLIMGETHEIVGVYGPEGRLILAPKRGSAVQVAFVPREASLLRGATVTHNHPSNGVFSPDDAALAAQHDVAELRAVASGGTVYVLLRPETGWPDSNAMEDAAERAWWELPSENVRRRGAGLPILKGRDRHDWMYRNQRDAFLELSVQMMRSDAWQM